MPDTGADSGAGGSQHRMSHWTKFESCCCCISLELGTRIIGAVFLILSLGGFVGYLIKLEDLRDFILEGLYSIPPCTIPPIDTLTDAAFEYSILANILLLLGCVSCTRWLLVPWLSVYCLNMVLMVATSLGMFLVPVPILNPSLTGTATHQALRLLGFIPLLFGAVIFYAWLVVRSRFIELGKDEKQDEDQCCPMGLKTGVQILGGILAILSGVMLVVFFAKLDEIIERQYYTLFEVELSRSRLTMMAASIFVSILVNILLVLGCSGKRWRRLLVLPWLLFYGAGVVICIWTHLYYTSLCWREEKMIGLCCLGIGFVFLIIWSLVWMVAAQITEKEKTLISRPNPLLFKRV